jgi:hypothetical protein
VIPSAVRLGLGVRAPARASCLIKDESSSRPFYSRGSVGGLIADWVNILEHDRSCGWNMKSCTFSFTFSFLEAS